MRGIILTLFVLTFLPVVAHAQQCPKETASGFQTSSTRQTLQGTLLFHDDLRQWFELRLDAPICGQHSIQLVTLQSWTRIEMLRGCHVTSTGTLGDSSTGYYSLDVYQEVDSIIPGRKCEPQKPFPDYSNVKPAAWVQRYRVDMEINYRPGDHPIIFKVTSGQHALNPWQAYASYDLTGDFAFYGHCAKNFAVDQIFGTRQANPRHFDEPRSPDDMATFDPESAAAAGVRDLKFGYTCIRMK